MKLLCCCHTREAAVEHCVNTGPLPPASQSPFHGGHQEPAVCLWGLGSCVCRGRLSTLTWNRVALHKNSLTCLNLGETLIATLASNLLHYWSFRVSHVFYLKLLAPFIPVPDTWVWELCPQYSDSEDQEEATCPHAGHTAAAVGARMYIWSRRDGYKVWNSQVRMLPGARPCLHIYFFDHPIFWWYNYAYALIRITFPTGCGDKILLQPLLH